MVPAAMMAKNVTVASPAVTLKLPVAVEPPCTSAFRNEWSLEWNQVVIEQADHFEDRNQADRIGAQNEDEEREQQRRPGVGPLVADVGTHHALAHELHDDLERVGAAGGHLIALPDVAPDDRRNPDEQQPGHEPEHENVLGNGKVDAPHVRQLDERMLTVGDVSDEVDALLLLFHVPTWPPARPGGTTARASRPEGHTNQGTIPQSSDERHGLELEHLDHDDDVHSEEHELGEKRAEHDPLHPGWVPPVRALTANHVASHRHERANHPTDHRAKRVHRASCALYLRHTSLASR
jgi:hypothetical protein